MGNKPDTGLPRRKVAVLGGGLAGLSAARRLLEHGCEVTLVERRPFLGGRAYSFRDGKDGPEVDNGQHVFLGCCTYYVDFLQAIGSFDQTYLPKTLRAEVVRDGVTGVLSSVPFLGRLHLVPSFAAYPHLGLKDKLLVGYGMLRARLTDRAKNSAELDGESAYDWLKRHHQTDRAINNLWNLFILPALNDDIRNVSADMALMVFQEALLKGPSDAAIGLARVGLTSLNGDPAARLLKDSGGSLRSGKAVKSIEVADDRVIGIRLSDGATIRADAYVSALPYGALLDALPGEVARGPFFSKASSLDSAPIVGIHLWYDRPVMNQDFVVFLGSPVQWVFNKSLIQGDRAGDGQYVCISLSGAWNYAGLPKDELIETFTKEMARLFPRAGGAKIERSFVVKELSATFRPTPGAAKHRLPQRTPISNFLLAGDWTQSGWPSTMEGAVRSGVFAADALVSAGLAD